MGERCEPAAVESVGIAVAKRTEHIQDALETMNIEKMDGNKEVLFNGEEFNIAKKDWYYRYHPLTVKINKSIVLENSIIDFKHYFTPL